MGTEDTSSPAVDGVAGDSNAMTAKNDDTPQLSEAAAAAAFKSDTEQTSITSTQLPSLCLQSEDSSAAYITVTDPIERKEGIKGKYTIYRVAYDPPLPTTADASDTNSNSNINSSSGNNDKALFPYAISVNRRYSDFSWLFDHLHKERPGAIVPLLPEKQSTSRFSESFIEERRFHLEIFLRRVVCNPELKDTECLLVFLGGGDGEFKKATRDGSFGASSASKSNAGGTASEDYNHLTDGMDVLYNEHSTNDQDHSYMDKSKEKLSTKKAGLKKWIKERKTTIKGTMVRSPDDAVFEEVTHFIAALEMGLKRIEAQASAMLKRDKDVSSCLLEFGLGCDSLAHIDDEGNGDTSNASGIGQTFRLIGQTADAISAMSADHYQRELNCFQEPLRDHLKTVHAVKVALSKRNNRHITYSTCLNAIDSKKASLHKYRITPGQENKAVSVESSLTRAETSVIVAKANYEEVSARVLREVDRFRKENAVAMYATMVEFARMQKDHHDKMHEAWGAVLPQVESVDAIMFNGNSFAQSAAVLREGKYGDTSRGGGNVVENVTMQVGNMSMPAYPPPVEPQAMPNALNSSMLNGAVRYRDPLPEE